MDNLTPGTQAHLDRLSDRARAVIARVPAVLPAYRGPVQSEPVPWTWTATDGRGCSGRPASCPRDAALCAQRKAERRQMLVDRLRCGAYPALPMRYL